MSSNIETLDLSGGDMSGMVPIKNNIVPKPEEKNISKEQKTTDMDFTPIDDVMGMNDLSGASLAQDPRMAPPAGGAPQQMMAQQQMGPGGAPAMMAPPQAVAPAQAPPPQAAAPPSKNPLNLTDEQVQALFVGLVAVVAFSRPVQTKMAQLIPQFLGSDGGRSSVGMGVTGISAAIMYYFGSRIISRN